MLNLKQDFNFEFKNMRCMLRISFEMSLSKLQETKPCKETIWLKNSDVQSKTTRKRWLSKRWRKCMNVDFQHKPNALKYIK